MNLLVWYRSLMRSVGATLVKLIATATSGLVSFTTNVIRPVKVTCKFGPVQEGTGVPSQDNVRPISGWTGVEIYSSSIQVWDEVMELGYWSVITGQKVSNSDYIRSKNFIPVKSGEAYYIKLGDGNHQKTILFFDINKHVISYTTGWQSGAVRTIPDGCYYITIYFNKNYGSEYKNDVCINYPATETDYHPYQGESFPITFTDPSTGDPMTVYGATVTLNEDGSADLAVTHGVKPISEWRYYTIRKQNPTAGWDAFQLYLPATDISVTGGAIVDGKPNIWSSEFVAVANAVTNPDYSIRKGNTYIYLAVPENTYANWDEFKTALADVPIVYPLATPLTYHFDNIGQLKSFLGENNIWHNMNGSITAEYWKKQ